MKKKNHRKFKEKKLEKTGKSDVTTENEKSSSDELAAMIKNACEGLIYISETDAEITLFEGKKAAEVSKQEVISQTESPADTDVEERDFADFFARLTKVEDWFGDEEQQIVEKFIKLKEILENNLRELKVFKLGKTELDIYVVGLDENDKLLGIKTKAVET